MQQQVRIITTKKGYEEIMSFLRSHNNKKLTKNIVNDTTCKYINDIYFFKWDNPKYFRLLKNLLTVIINKNITQRICIIDRNYIKLYDNTLLEDEYKDIPNRFHYLFLHHKIVLQYHHSFLQFAYIYMNIHFLQDNLYHS